MRKYKLVHLVRGVTPTSMPWNDLYKTHRGIDKIKAGLVVAIGFVKGSSVQLESTSRIPYLYLNLISAIIVLHRLISSHGSRNETTIIHVHNMVLIPFAIAFKSDRVKLILNVHNSLENFNFLQSFILKAFIRYFDGIVAVSNSVADQVRAAFPRKANDVIAILNGVSELDLREVSSLSDFPEKEIDVIVVARMVEQKNIEKIIRVLSHVKSLKTFVWYGDGKKLQIVREMVSQASLGSRTQLRGIRPRREVLDSINASKLYLSLSKWEGIGVANIEALSFATEVMLSDIPPHRELWCDDNLYLVDRKTSDTKIAAKIESILSEGDKRQWFLVQRAKETRVRFDLPVLVSSYIKIYDRIAGSR